MHDEGCCRFAAGDKAVVDTFNQVDAFGKLTRAASKVTEAGSQVPPADVVAMHAALLAFTAAVYPDRLDLVNKVLTSAYQVQPSRFFIHPVCWPVCRLLDELAEQPCALHTLLVSWLARSHSHVTRTLTV